MAVPVGSPLHIILEVSKHIPKEFAVKYAILMVSDIDCSEIICLCGTAIIVHCSCRVIYSISSGYVVFALGVCATASMKCFEASAMASTVLNVFTVVFPRPYFLCALRRRHHFIMLAIGAVTNHYQACIVQDYIFDSPCYAWLTYQTRSHSFPQHAS